MEKKNKYILYGILAGFIVYIIFQLLPFLTCNDDLGCLFFMILPQILGFMIVTIFKINLPLKILLFVNAFFYSLFGAFIGWLVYYFRYERKTSKKSKKKK